MSFCIECGVKLWPGAKFCAECGAKAPGSLQSAADSPKQISFTPMPPTAPPKRTAEEPIHLRSGSNPGKQPIISPNGATLKKATSQPEVSSRVQSNSNAPSRAVVAAAPKKFAPVTSNSSPPSVPAVPPPPRRGLMASADDIVQSPSVPARNKLTRSSPDVTNRAVNTPPPRSAPKLNIMTQPVSPPVPRAVAFADSPPTSIPSPPPLASRSPFTSPRTASPARVTEFGSPPTTVPSVPKYAAQTMPMNIPAVSPRTGPLSPPRGMSPKAPFTEPPSAIPLPPRAGNNVESPPTRIPPPPTSPKLNLSNTYASDYEADASMVATSPRKEFAMPSIPAVPKVSPRPMASPPNGFSPPIPIPPRGNSGPTFSPPVSPRGYGIPAPSYQAENYDEEPPMDLPPPPPAGKKPVIGAPTKGWLIDPSRSGAESTGPVLIPIKGTSSTVARQGDTKAMPTSDNEVILTKTTYKADTNVAPLTVQSVNPGSMPKAPPKEPGKRISFNTVVAMAVGHDGEGYQAKVVGHENRNENLDSSKTITVFKIEVQKGGQTWHVFRRHAQFAKLTQKLKDKRLLGYNELNLPSKKSDSDASVQLLNNFLTSILSREEVATSHYVNNFLQPLQLGDTKPK